MRLSEAINSEFDSFNTSWIHSGLFPLKSDNKRKEADELKEMSAGSSLESSERRCRELEGKLNSMKEELELVLSENEKKSSELELYKAQYDDLRKRSSDSIQKVELLQMDKTFLSKEIENHQGKIQSLEEKVDRQRCKLHALKKNREELLQQTLQLRSDGKLSYDDKLHKSLESIRAQTKADL